MNRKDAQVKAREGSLTVGELRQIVEGRRQAAGPRIGEMTSAVNPVVPLLKALDVYAGSLGGRDADEVPKAWYRDVYSGRDKPSGDALLIANILRDCA